MDKNKPAIEIENLSVCFDGNYVLKDFSLDLAFGEKVTLTGPSGSGKSTVLRAILGFVNPVKGSIKIMGETLNEKNIWKKRLDIAYVAQEPDLGEGTVQNIIKQPFSYHANSGLRSNLDRLSELMQRFNLSQSLLGKQMATLSGGEKQRIALVIAILLDRSIFLLDEASSALDKINRQAIADYFKQAPNITVLSVAHDVEWLGFATRVVDIQKLSS